MLAFSGSSRLCRAVSKVHWTPPLNPGHPPTPENLTRPAIALPRSVATEAGMYAIRARRKTVTEKDFLDAVNKVIKGE